MTRHFEWVTARTLRHLHVNGNGTNIDAPIPKAGDLPHVSEIQDYVIRACNSHDELIEALETLKKFTLLFVSPATDELANAIIDSVNCVLKKAKGE